MPTPAAALYATVLDPADRAEPPHVTAARVPEFPWLVAICHPDAPMPRRLDSQHTTRDAATLRAHEVNTALARIRDGQAPALRHPADDDTSQYAPADVLPVGPPDYDLLNLYRTR